MANELITNDDPAVFWAQCLTPNAAAVLSRAFEPGATFSADEVALVEPIASAVATIRPADEEIIRKSIGSLSAVLPSKDNGEAGERLRLNVYMSMLAGCDERALAHACRRCCEELDWMPTIHQLKERMRGWMSPEAVAIIKARAVLRAPRSNPEGEEVAGEITAESIRSMSPSLRSVGIHVGAITEGDVESALAGAGAG